MLTKVQKEIVEADMGPMLVTAGAGSGKTRVLTHRIIHVINSGIPDSKILALTFTNKAAGEMKERVEKTLGSAISTFLGTFHSFCARLLRKNIQHLNKSWTSDFSIYATTDTQKVIKEILANNTFIELEKDSWKTIEWHLSAMKNDGLTAEEYRKEIEHLTSCDEILRVICAYDKRLADCNALDFDDLLLKTLDLFETAPHILAELQRRFDYILVDEFQDTNVIQYKIVSKLAQMHKNIMCVGDEDQCIYTWRGASIENITSFKRDFPSVRIYKLEENFRSGKNIVSLANKLVAHNTNRLDKILFSNLPEGEIHLDKCWNEREEAEKVVTTIARMVKQGSKHSDFAILMRINALSRAFEEKLLEYNIPHYVWGGFKFYERSEIKSVINYLRVMVNPKDEIALLDVLNWPRRGVGDSSVAKLRDLSNGAGIACYDLIIGIEAYKEQFSAKSYAGICEFKRVIESLIEIHNSFGLRELANNLVSTIGVESAFKTSKKEEDLNRLENIFQLENAIRSYAEDNPDATLGQYLQSVSLVSDADNSAGDDAVIISTVHSAKGLEFKNVFIVGLEDGLFPLSRAKNSEAELEEERRLLYVAITRARENLTLSYCGTRFYQGERKACMASPFLKETDLMPTLCGENSDNWNENRSYGGSSAYSGYSARSNNSSNFNFKNASAPVREFSNFTTAQTKADTRLSEPEKTAESIGAAVGKHVKHEKFGIGQVVEIIDKSIVKINFASVGFKMLSVAYANLEVVE